MDEKYRSRKFGLTLLIILLATGLLIGASISGDNWVTVVLASLGGYGYMNIQEKKNGSTS